MYDLPPGYPVLYGSDLKVRVIERDGRLFVIVLDTFTMRDATVQAPAVEGAELLIERNGVALTSPAVLRAGVEALQTLARMWGQIADELDPQPVKVKRDRYHMLQAINFSYGQLAASSNHKPVRSAFAKLAEQIGMSPEEFETWAADKKWVEVEPLPWAHAERSTQRWGRIPDTESTAPIKHGYFGATRQGPYEVRQRRDGDYDARLLPDGFWNVCPAAYYRGEFTPAKDSIRERAHVPVQYTASDVTPPAEPWPGALSGMAPPWITDEPLSAEVAGAGEQWFPPDDETVHDLLLLVVEAPPKMSAIAKLTREQRLEIQDWVAATVAAANDHEDVEIPPYPSCLGPTKNGQPEPCGACGKRGHITGTCPEG